MFLPTGLGKAEETFVIVCDNCQTKELVVVGGAGVSEAFTIGASAGHAAPAPAGWGDLRAHCLELLPHLPLLPEC